MDRHVRWFRREIAVAVAQRLAVEVVVVGAAVLIVGLLAEASPPTAVLAAILVIPGFVVIRLALACMSNPMTSVYLMRWPHPSGDVRPVEQTNVGSTTDTALKGYQFLARGALDEWGGAATNLYTRGSNQIVVATSDDDDLVVISRLDDDRMIVTTKQLIPPHEELIMNRQITSDVRAVLASHVELVKELTADGHNVVVVGLDDVIELLAIEWDAWDQIGPVIGPFVSLGQRRQPSLLQASVSPDEMLRRTGTPEPRIRAKRAAAAAIEASDRRAQLATPTSVAPDAVVFPRPALQPPPLPQVPPVVVTAPVIDPQDMTGEERAAS